ncbi:zinc finger protein GLIS2 homolog [Watersipora subatra]|uniref:zinc finger protein GLIS2 homolog n=1 Tax=Watersipora subatra TaxID=2589382 RepID=UPI00355B3376
MDLSRGVTSRLGAHGENPDSDSFMLSVSIEDEDDNGLHPTDIVRTDGTEPVLSDIEGVPYLLDTDCLLTEASSLGHQEGEGCQSMAISLHSYSQALPIIASEGLHNYSQPLSLPLVGANTEVLHNYSQPWPQSTDSYTSVHNYCIATESVDPLKEVQPQNEIKIFKLSKPDESISSGDSNERLHLKLQLVDSFICKWKNCDMTFPSIQSLAKHTAEHVSSQPVGFYRCLWKDCTRKEALFEERYRLVQHMRIHTAEKPHKCSLCQAEFATAEGLTKHQRVHTGEKPYACPHTGCMKAFKNSADRYKHVQTHKSKRPYHCKYPDCGKMYTDPGTLRKHVRQKHPDVIPPSKGPTVEKKVQAATLLSDSGVETSLNVDEFTVSSFNGSIYCDDNALLSTAAGSNTVGPEEIQRPPIQSNQRIRTLLNDSSTTSNRDSHLDLVTSPETVDWDTYSALDET